MKRTLLTIALVAAAGTAGAQTVSTPAGSANVGAGVATGGSATMSAPPAGATMNSNTQMNTNAQMPAGQMNNGQMNGNMGANANQPLITNQNYFQIFDNVTRVAGKHTLKAGGSYTHRSREILNADTIVGRFDFNQNLTSNCSG